MKNRRRLLLTLLSAAVVLLAVIAFSAWFFRKPAGHKSTKSVSICGTTK